MSGQQEITGGFDLDTFVSKSGAEAGQGNDVVTVKVSKAKTKPKPAIEPKVEEQLSERLQVRLTPSEFARLKKKAGLVPHSTYVRDFLKQHGLL